MSNNRVIAEGGAFRTIVCACLTVLAIAFTSTSLLARAEPPPPPPPHADESFLQGRMPFYVRYAPGRSDVVEQAVTASDGRVTHRLDRVESLAVLLAEPAAEALASRKDVVLVEPVPQHRLAGQVVPYNIDQYQARDIWDTNRDGQVDAGAPDGSGVKFCIIDTGLYAAHDDFAGVTISGFSQIDGEEWFEDGNGHGTHVAGTANAVHNDIGVVGTMPGGAELIILKIFNNNGQWVMGQSNLGAAAQTCRDMGANVLSMSLGGGSSSTENAIFQDLYDNFGILNIAAAGNDGNTTRSYPASYDSVISVGAIDSAEEAAVFTQYPETSYDPDNPPANAHWDVVEFAGGGVNVLSTWPGPPHGEVPIYQVSVNGITYQGVHMEESGLGDVTGPLIDGGLCDSAGSWSGAVVICERGSIAFADKINNVRDGGGLGAVIYNNEPGDLLGTCGGNCTTPLIPAIGITQADGQELVSTALGDSANLIADDGTGCTDCTGSYNAISGTSMATPGVAAALALAWDACGGPAELTNKDIRLLLRDSAKDLSGVHPGTGFEYGAGWDRVTGWGLVQLLDAQELGNALYGSVCPIGLEVNPPVLEVCGLNQASAQTTITLDDAFLGVATMSVSGLPLNASGSFDPNPVVYPIKDTVLTLSGLDNVASGSYAIEVTATDEVDPTNTAPGFLTLALSSQAPGQPVLQLPADGATSIPLRPTLSWAAASEANEYRLEIATDSAFTSIVYSAAVTDTSHTVTTDLASITTYYWRVTASNYCGDGIVSSTSSFTTTNVVCELIGSTDVPKAIADATGGMSNPTPGVTDSTLQSAFGGSLLSVEVVDLKGTHSWFSDLSFDLISPANTTVRIMERSCGDEDNFHLGLSDDASGSPGGWPCPPIDQGTYQPSNPLSGFDGDAADGTWTLRITDHERFDDGTLESWGLNLCVQGESVSSSTTEITQIDPAGEQTVHQAYTVHVTVSGDEPTGAVDVDDGTGGACQITLSDGTGSCALTSTTVGTKSITAHYLGDGGNGVSSQSVAYAIVADAPDSLAFAGGPTDTVVNEIMNPAVVVHVLDQYGNRVEWDNSTGVSLGLIGGSAGAVLSGGDVVQVANGAATFAGLSVDLAGTDYQLEAGDSGNALGTTASAPFDILGFASTTTITGISPAVSQQVGEGYTVAVAVTGEGPTGQVTVSDGVGNSCVVNLDEGQESCVLVSDVVGDKTITAQYPGDGSNGPSSDSAAYTIVHASSVVEITAVDPAEAQQIDQIYTVHVSVDGYQPSGEVAVNDGTGANCQFKLPEESSCELISTTSGMKTLNASYPGDENNEPASASVPYEITPSGPVELHFAVAPDYGVETGDLHPDVVIHVLDSEGNRVEDDNDTVVVISLETNPAGATLSGTLSETVTGGEAVFSDLHIDQMADGYQLQAADDAGTLDVALSGFFDVLIDGLFSDQFQSVQE